MAKKRPTSSVTTYPPFNKGPEAYLDEMATYERDAKPIPLPDESTGMSRGYAQYVLKRAGIQSDEEVLQACQALLFEIKFNEQCNREYMAAIETALKEVRNRIRIHMSPADNA